MRKKKFSGRSSYDSSAVKEKESKVSSSTKRAVNLEVIKNEFSKCSDFVIREITIQDKQKASLVYLEGLVKSDELQEHILQPILVSHSIDGDIIESSQIKRTSSPSEVIDTVLQGNAALLIDGEREVLLLNVRGGVRRGVEEPVTEASIRGPREGFTENLRTNTSLIRFRFKSAKLKMVPFTIGEQTKTSVVLAYQEDLIEPKVLREVTRRLQSIKIDGVLESGYIEELIQDSPYSPYPQLQYTERPDTVAAHLLEGKFAILVDNTPFVMVGPVTFWQMMQASEDYYERFYIANFIRLLRYTFMFLALYLPAIYIAVLTYHHDMIPTNLLYSIATAREAIPFPVLVEALIMELSFEALREAGIRLPKTVGQAVSILGALVIGQAAVEAGIVSAPMVMIVAMTGIASFTMPRFNFAITVRLLRFPLMLLAGILGLFGIMIGTFLIAVHLCHLRSFGVPYMSGYAPLKRKELKDIFIRAPWWKMKTRPASYKGANPNSKRMDGDMKPMPPQRKG